MLLRSLFASPPNSLGVVFLFQDGSWGEENNHPDVSLTSYRFGGIVKDLDPIRSLLRQGISKRSHVVWKILALQHPQDLWSQKGTFGTVGNSSRKKIVISNPVADACVN